MEETTGCPEDLLTGRTFVVPERLVQEVGAVQALLYQRIAWRCHREGSWRGTITDLAKEVGVSYKTAQRALDAMRERGWLDAESTSFEDRTLIWTVPTPGQNDRGSGQNDRRGSGQDDHLSTYEVENVKERTTRSGPAPDQRIVARSGGRYSGKPNGRAQRCVDCGEVAQPGEAGIWTSDPDSKDWQAMHLNACPQPQRGLAVVPVYEYEPPTPERQAMLDRVRGTRPA